MKNHLYGDADDSTLVRVVPSPGERIAVTEALNRYLNRVRMWCEVWEIIIIIKNESAVESREEVRTL